MKAALLVLLLLPACYSEPAPGLLCADDGSCPEGQVCTGGHCLLPGQTGPDGAGAADLIAACLPSLSNIGQADFSIAFTLKTKATSESTVIYQRQGCDALHNFWAVTLQPTGVLSMELNEADTGQYTVLQATALVNDGRPYKILFYRHSLVLVATTNSDFSGSAAAPQQIGALSPLGIEKGNPCEAGGLHPLDGTVSSVCLSLGRLP